MVVRDQLQLVAIVQNRCLIVVKPCKVCTIEIAVEMTAVIMRMYAINPGTRNSALRSSGLYQIRGSTDSNGGGAAAPGASAAPALLMMVAA